jgi:hypothetical protein
MLSFGEIQRQAWGMVLASIQDAIDLDGLQPVDRGQLVELHERVAWRMGAPTIAIPPDWISAPTWEITNAPGGLRDLCGLGVDADTLAVLTYTARLLRIETSSSEATRNCCRFPASDPNDCARSARRSGATANMNTRPREVADNP